VAAGLDGDQVPPGGGLRDPEAPAELGDRVEAVVLDEVPDFLTAPVDEVLGHAHEGAGGQII
jgi:hypothetical protein